MKRTGILLPCFLYFLLIATGVRSMDRKFQNPPDSSRQVSLNIIPRPFMVKQTGGSFHLTKETVLLLGKGTGNSEIEVFSAVLTWLHQLLFRLSKSKVKLYQPGFRLCRSAFQRGLYTAGKSKSHIYYGS
jgi:hypothetical protein